jgi:hypothetical protein
MKLTIQHFGVPSTDALDSQVEERLLALAPRLRIDEAIVTLAHRREYSPPFRARIFIETPGPDLFVEAAGHTVDGTFTQAMTELGRKLATRDRNRTWRARSDRQQPARMRPGAGTRAAC